MSHLHYQRPCKSSTQSFVVPQSVLSSREFVKEFNISCHNPEPASHKFPYEHESYDCSLQIRCADLRRWQLALEHEDLTKITPDAFVDRVRNLPRFDGLKQSLPFCLGFGLVSLLYGGLHCIAWNAPFATDIGRLLWRISSLAVAGTGALFALLILWTHSKPSWTAGYKFDDDPLSNMMVFMGLPIYRSIEYLEGREVCTRNSKV